MLFLGQSEVVEYKSVGPLTIVQGSVCNNIAIHPPYISGAVEQLNGAYDGGISTDNVTSRAVGSGGLGLRLTITGNLL